MNYIKVELRNGAITRFIREDDDAKASKFSTLGAEPERKSDGSLRLYSQAEVDAIFTPNRGVTVQDIFGAKKTIIIPGADIPTGDTTPPVTPPVTPPDTSKK